MRLKVGIAGPMTGPRRAYGDQICATVAQFLAQSGADFDIVFGDDKADHATARAVARSFLDQGVHVVIGHFNSECARQAGQIYRASKIPLLLPASTAPTLAEEIGAFRLCADETKQISAMAIWHQTRQFVGCEVWADGTVYGARLATAFRSQLDPAKYAEMRCIDQGPVYLFGTHANVAQQINALSGLGQSGPFVGCDDCVIPEFQELLDSKSAAEIWVAQPSPDFFTTLYEALDLVNRLDTAKSLMSQLSAHPMFVNAERPEAGFVLTQLSAPGHDSPSKRPAKIALTDLRKIT